ncbi:hypothetical protein L9F63_026387, partial [Diploptera punctata]
SSTFLQKVANLFVNDYFCPKFRGSNPTSVDGFLKNYGCLLFQSKISCSPIFQGLSLQ